MALFCGSCRPLRALRDDSPGVSFASGRLGETDLQSGGDAFAVALQGENETGIYCLHCFTGADFCYFFSLPSSRNQTHLKHVGRRGDGKVMSVQAEGDFGHAPDLLTAHRSLQEERRLVLEVTQ